MADNNGGGGAGTTLLAVIVGGMLVVLVAIFAFGGIPGIGGHRTASVTISAPTGTR